MRLLERKRRSVSVLCCVHVLYEGEKYSEELICAEKVRAFERSGSDVNTCSKNDHIASLALCWAINNELNELQEMMIYSRMRFTNLKTLTCCALITRIDFDPLQHPRWKEPGQLPRKSLSVALHSRKEAAR